MGCFALFLSFFGLLFSFLSLRLGFPFLLLGLTLLSLSLSLLLFGHSLSFSFLLGLDLFLGHSRRWRSGGRRCWSGLRGGLQLPHLLVQRLLDLVLVRRAGWNRLRRSDFGRGGLAGLQLLQFLFEGLARFGLRISLLCAKHLRDQDTGCYSHRLQKLSNVHKGLITSKRVSAQ